MIQLKNFAINKYGLNVRLVNEYDAEFIIELRTNPLLSKHLHHTSQDVELQVEWIKEYKKREEKGEEFYFAFSDSNSEKVIGFARIHDINYIEKTFHAGSWIFEKNINQISPLLSEIIIKELGFDLLELEYCYFDVRKENKHVIKYHLRYEPQLISEDIENNYYCLSKDCYKKNINKILTYLI